MTRSANIVASLFIPLLVLCAPAALPAQGADDTIRAVEQHYRELRDLRANVVQKNFLKSLSKTQTFDGTLWIKKPGKLRLEYANGQLIVVDGKTALFYSRKSEQVVRKSFSDVEQMNIPVAFLLGAGQISDSFAVRGAGNDSSGRIELVPKKAGAAMKKLTLATDGDGRIAELTIFDRSGNRTEIKFSDVLENSGVDDSLFRFVAPKGTEVIEQ
jgi:outer membrane lipoprotein carrier protein